MLSNILVLMFLISIPMLLGKQGQPFRQNLLGNILSMSPLVLLFIDFHLASNIILLTAIGAIYGISNKDEFTTSAGKKALFILYSVLSILFVLNNLSVILP